MNWYWSRIAAIAFAYLLVLKSNAALPTASRQSPASSAITVITGSSQTFVVRGTDTDGNLRGAEWYLNGVPKVSHFTMSGSSATDSWTNTFNSAGTYTVEALVFDTAGGYSGPATWTVTVQNNVAPVASRSSPSGSSVVLLPGSSQTFIVRGTDSNGNLRGAEWYLNGVPKVSHFTMSGSSATDSWTNTFNSAGTYTVEAMVFDTLNAYSTTPATWTVTVQPDTTPPSPNPMTFSTSPYGYSTTSIRMMATQASDNWYGVEYYFFCALNGGGGGDYGFTVNREYIDTGLSVNSRYGYQVLARDTSPNHNEGGYSSTRYAYTLANTPSAPVIGGATGNSLNVDVQPNGNPSSTEFALYNETSGYFVTAAGGNSGSTPVWRTDSQWGNVTVTGLAQSSTYTFKVKARNGDNVDTVLGAGAAGTTLNVNYSPTAARSGPTNANPKFMFVTGGTTIRFQVLANDQNGNLTAVDWYVNGQLRATQVVSGYSATNTWTNTFPATGTYVVEAQPYDSQGGYSEPALWTVSVLSRTRGMYVSPMQSTLGNQAAENSLLEYAKRNAITYLAFYLGNEPSLLDVRLDSLIQRARSSFGVTQIGFVGGSISDFNNFVAYNSAHTGKTDVLNLEYEYWANSPRDFITYKSLLQSMRTIGTPQGLKVEAYIGWSTSDEILELSGLVDRLLVHFYVTDPGGAWTYGRDRVLPAGNAADHLTIWPIFSTESSGHYTEQPFMGDWLASHSLDQAEDIVMSSYASETDVRKYNIGLLGFQYFVSKHMSPLLYLTALGYSPAHAESGVGVTANLVITLNTNVTRGTSGNITIKRTVDNATFEIIPFGDARVSVSGSQVVINPSGAFSAATEYYVLIDETCFRSSTSAYFPGISVANSWRFMTLAASPEMDVQGNSVSIVDGDSTPTTTDHTDFGSALVAGGTVVRTFTVRNTGDGALNLSGSPKVVVGGTQAAEFTVTAQPSSPVAAAGTTTFQVMFDPAGAGTRSATLSIANDDANENPYNFSIQGSGTTAPEMDVQGNSASIVDGDSTPSLTDHTDFGSTLVAGGTVIRTYTIRNTGAATLNLAGSPRVAVSGTHAADFTVTTQPSSPVAAAGTTTFQVTFDPSAVGTRTAALSIANDDANENPYNYSIQGTGTVANVAPTNILLSSTNVAESLPISTTVGSFGTQDPDAGNTFTYALVSGSGSTDNGSFTISESNLLTAAIFNYEVKSNYSIRVQSTDQGSLSTQRVFAIRVTDVDETPVFYGPSEPANGNIVLRWSSTTNKLYTVHHSTNLLTGFSVLQSNIPATPAINSYTQSVLTVPQRFWKITTDQ